MTTIYLVRHGEAEGNIFRRFHGQYNSLLTPRGYQQVERVSKRFENIHLDACYSSDLTRTSLTARSVYIPQKLPLRRDPRFREVHVGRWEDVPYGYLNIFEADQMHRFSYDPENWFVEGGELFEAHTQRFLEGLTAAAENFDGGTIAVFSHGALIRNTLFRLFFRDDISDLKYSDNTGVCKLIYHNGSFTYDFLNDNSHIPQELSTHYIQRWWRDTGKRRESSVYFKPVSQTRLPPELKIPDGDVQIAAILCDACVGVISLGNAEGSRGTILGMELLDGFDGRYYGDQMLGEAFSHFRLLGCKELYLAPGIYPDDLTDRYGFNTESRRISIDADAFCWEPEE